MKNLFILVLIILIFTSCVDCEDTSEPLAIFLFKNEYVEYKEVRGINSEDIINVTNFDDGYPLSIVSDTTTLLFYDTASIDTLSIRYKRNFDFESNQCGFTVTLSDFENLPQTSFDSLSFKIYESSDGYPVASKKNLYVVEIFN